MVNKTNSRLPLVDENNRRLKTRYPYELTRKGLWKCLTCNQEMKYIDEIEEHHNVHEKW